MVIIYDRKISKLKNFFNLVYIAWLKLKLFFTKKSSEDKYIVVRRKISLGGLDKNEEEQ